MKKLNNKRGFTLIELLVVIAIIGILSSIVLASLSTARNKGNDAKVKGQLASVRNAAEIYYGNNNSYGASSAGSCTTGMFADATSSMANLVASSSYPSGTTVVCNSNTTTYSVGANLSSGAGSWCVDSTGKSEATAATIAAGAANMCP